MKLEPLIDKEGAVKVWADKNSGWICNRVGSVLAFVEFDGLFAFSGAQIGWWFGKYATNRYGRVVLARPGAKIAGLNTPHAEKVSSPPKMHMPSDRPPLRWLLPPPPIRPQSWGDFTSLFSGWLGPSASVRTTSAQLG